MKRLLYTSWKLYVFFILLSCALTPAKAYSSQIQSPLADTIITYQIDSIFMNACHGDSTAAILITASSSAGAITSYQWSNGDTTEDLIYVKEGNYSCTITDDKGNSITTETIAIRDQPKMSIALSGYNPKGNNTKDGYLDVRVTGGLAPYNYQWSNGANTATFDQANPTTHIVSVTDSLGCQVIDSISLVAEPCDIVVSTLTVPTACAGVSTGGAEIDIEGILAPATYVWSNGDSTQNLTNVKEGKYTLDVTDRRGCKTSAEITVDIEDTEGPVLIPYLNRTFYLDAKGEVVLNVTDIDSASYDLCQLTDIKLDKINFNCSDLGDQRVTLIATDQKGQSTSQSIAIEILDTIKPIFTCVDTIQGNICNGGLQFSFPQIIDNCYDPDRERIFSGPKLGSQPDFGTYNMRLAYEYAPSQFLRCNTSLVVKDSSSLQVLTEDVTCPDDNNGSISLVVRGGKAPIIYDWENGQTKGQLLDLTKGYYPVVVYEAEGCAFDITPQVKGPDDFAVLVDTIYQTDELYTAKVTVLGGTPPYTYNWKKDGDLISTTKSLVDVPSGIYELTVEDSKGCLFTSYSLDIANVTSVNKSVDHLVKMYPNPIEDLLKIDVPKELGTFTAGVYDLQGRLITKQTNRLGNISIRVSTFDSGYYMVLVRGKDFTVLRKMVKL